MTTSTPSTFIDSGVMLLDLRHQIPAVCTSIQSVIRRQLVFFLYIWSVLCLYLEASTVEFIAEKLGHIVNKSTKALWYSGIDVHHYHGRFLVGYQQLCNLPWLCTGGSQAYKASGLLVSVHSINQYSSPSSHEITIGFVSSLFGYLMCYSTYTNK